MTDVTPGLASDELPEVLATGRANVTTIFASMSARHPEGRDADFLKWHSLDHRPEQHRLAQASGLITAGVHACLPGRPGSER